MNPVTVFDIHLSSNVKCCIAVVAVIVALFLVCLCIGDVGRCLGMDVGSDRVQGVE